LREPEVEGAGVVARIASKGNRPKGNCKFGRSSQTGFTGRDFSSLPTAEGSKQPKQDFFARDDAAHPTNDMHVSTKAGFRLSGTEFLASDVTGQEPKYGRQSATQNRAVPLRNSAEQMVIIEAKGAVSSR
jgi:hypothetical protein